MRNFVVSIYFIKAAERDVIHRAAYLLLRGLNFAAAYTPHFAMCTDNLSEILLTTNADARETRSVMRFSCSGLCPKPDLKRMREEMDDRCSMRPETVGLWYRHERDYFDRAATKANQALQKTLKEIGCTSGDAFNILVINNDMIPMFELLASKEYDHLEISRPGDVTQFRYEVGTSFRNIMNWRLVHAYKFK